jgi:hypothetical protein
MLPSSLAGELTPLYNIQYSGPQYFTSSRDAILLRQPISQKPATPPAYSTGVMLVQIAPTESSSLPEVPTKPPSW